MVLYNRYKVDFLPSLSVWSSSQTRPKRKFSKSWIRSETLLLFIESMTDWLTRLNDWQVCEDWIQSELSPSESCVEFDWEKRVKFNRIAIQSIRFASLTLTNWWIPIEYQLDWNGIDFFSTSQHSEFRSSFKSHTFRVNGFLTLLFVYFLFLPKFCISFSFSYKACIFFVEL